MRARANRQTVAFGSSQFQADPVTPRHTMIAKKHRGPVDIFHHDVELSVDEQVTNSQAARCLPLHQGRTRLISSVTEPAILLVEVEHSRLLIARTGQQSRDLGIHVSADEDQVQPSLSTSKKAFPHFTYGIESNPSPDLYDTSSNCQSPLLR
jgi:hypothetical protein